MVQYSQTFFNETIRQWTNQYIESGKNPVNAQKLALKRYTRIYGKTTYPVPPLSIEAQRMINLKRNPRKSKLSVSEIEKNIDETENEYRFRLNNPSKYDESSFRYKKIKRGISLVIACEKGSFFHNKCIGSTESQSIRFSKEEFGYNISGKKKVVAWLQKHLRKFK